MVRFQVKAPDPNRRYHLYPAPEMLTEPPADLLAAVPASYGWTYVDYIPSSCISYFLFATDDPSRGRAQFDSPDVPLPGPALPRSESADPGISDAGY